MAAAVSMNTTNFYRAHKQASDRVGRIRNDLNRSSAYILAGSPGPSDASYRRPSRPRDSSLGASFRMSSSSSSYVPSSPVTPRRRESSITLNSPTLTRRNSALNPSLGAETAKYNREESIREIKANFDRQFQETQKKLRPEDGEERMTKARAKIIGTIPSAWDDQSMKRNCISDMYMEMKRFSSKTVAAINSVADCDFSKRKEDYKWRKDLEQYENSREFERDVRIRNIDMSRKRKEAREAETSYIPSRDSSTRKTMRATPRASSASGSAAARPPLAPSPTSTPAAKKERKIEPAEKKELPPRKEKTVTINAPEKETEPAAPAPAQLPAPVAAPTPAQNASSSSSGPRKSWRDRFNERQEKQRQLIIAEFSSEAEERAKKLVSQHLDATAPKMLAASQDLDNDESTPMETDQDTQPKQSPEGDAAAPGQADEDGTKKMKSEFDTMMASLDQEMEQGRSKLAKLRERIRRAKASIKAADEAIEASEKS